MSHEEQSRFSYLRQLNALKLEQKKAIHEENFERAAELRDADPQVWRRPTRRPRSPKGQQGKRLTGVSNTTHTPE